MAAKHESFFNYNQTRPYPFRWFTPVVVTVLIIGTTLFSFLNLILTGYTFVSEVSTDPNSTFSQEKWIRGLPSYLSSRLKATCQPALLNPQDFVSTNNSALTYTITGISLAENGQIFSSMEYQSNVLTNCSIVNVDIDLGAFDRALNQIAFLRWTPTVRTFIWCLITDPRGQITVNLTNEYNYVPSDTSLSRMGTFLGSGFLTRNETTKPSLWWGESMMSWYWLQVSMRLQRIQDSGNATYNIRKAFLSFTRDSATDDVTSLDYFTIQSRFLDEDNPRDFPRAESTSVANLDSQETYPNIWVPADTLAKSAYWTILTDLGQTSVNGNILTSQQLLSHFTSNFSRVAEEGSIHNALPGPATEPWKASQGTLNDTISAFEPSVISTSYLCQIPKVKSTGNLILAIIVADLVFVQLLWRIMVLVVDNFWLKDKSQNATAAAFESDRRKRDAHMWSGSGDIHELNVLSPAGKGDKRGARRPGHRRQSSSSYHLLG